MRTALTVLLAFAAGVLLMLWLPNHATAPADTPVPATAASAGAAPASSVADSDSGGDEGSAIWPDNGPTPEQVLYAQPQRLQDALANRR